VEMSYGHLEVTDDFGGCSVIDDGAGLGTRVAAPPLWRFSVFLASFGRFSVP
jgi:hypothetical protein